MKKFWILFISLGFFLALPKEVLAQAATLSLDPANGTFNQGCSFSLNVSLDTGGAQTDGTDAILIYDPSRFNATSITNGIIYPDYPGNNIDNIGGKVTISGLASVNTPFSGKGTLATVNFTVASTTPAGATQVKFDFDPTNKAKTTDSNVVERATIADVLNSVVNGNYTIGTGACAGATTRPTTTPITRGGQGGAVISTPSASTPFIPIKTLPDGGTQELTFTLAIVGSVLTVLGILGLALL